MDPFFEIEFHRPAKGSRQSSRGVYQQLREAIEEGRLPSGSKLPPTRTATSIFGVSRNTVAEAYGRLQNDGYINTRRGSGTYVASKLPSTNIRRPATKPLPADGRLNPFWLRPDTNAAIGFWRDATSQTVKSRLIDFRPALVDPRLFPHEVFRRIISAQLRRLEKKPPRYKSPQGHQGSYPLREAITKHLALTRALVCAPDDLVVTAGAQQAFDLLARILVRPNETVVAIENPNYPPLRAPFAAAGAKLVPVEVDGEGLVVEKLPRDAKIICTCPSHQFPLGMTMSARRRRALIQFAHKQGAVIIEDDYDGEFRHSENSLGALYSAETRDIVFYIGTFSKCMLPSFRLGFVVAPDWAKKALIAAKNCADWHCPTALQLAVASFIADGHLSRHVRRMREIYRKRRQALLKTIAEEMDGRLDPVPSSYGMHLAAFADGSMDADRLAEILQARNVQIHALKRYYLGRTAKPGFVFGFGTADIPDLKLGIALLRGAAHT